MLENFMVYVPVLSATASVTLFLWVAYKVFLRGKIDLGAEAKLPGQLLMLVLTAAGLVVVLMMVPMSSDTRGQVLSLLGIVFTGVIALSSTTFVANAMAGMMLRIIRSFRSGDFIRINNSFGRVTERGLFHTEIQSRNRDLITFPNLYVMTHPVTVVRTSGTVVSAKVSLGYDVSSSEIEKLLLKAAEQAGLQDSFVLVEELGDFSVTYMISGFLKEVKYLLSASSNLRKEMLDTLHEAGVEIVSPTFMNQRLLPDGSRFVPGPKYFKAMEQAEEDEKSPEDIVFDKAEQAEELERLRNTLAELDERLELMKQDTTPAGETGRPDLEKKVEKLKQRIEELTEDVDG